MRQLLELLGLVAPPAGRREPVVLPAWTRWAIRGSVVVLALLSVLVMAIVRAVLT